MPKICLMCGNSFPDSTTFCPTDGSALRASVQGDDLIGELVAERYLITDMLSQGGMGAVYVASDVRLPQQFAIKVLKQANTTDQSLIARFRQEAEAVCRINHDRVARVYDFGFLPDARAYIVMEYVAGKTLRKLGEERGPMDPVEVAKIIGMAAEGIDAAHRLGIVHRDLKPENVMLLDDPGGGMRVKVLDFGIAKLENAETDQGYTQPGFVIGTPAWMSPEQLLGEQLDARSDVYALGLVAFALLTGEHAFTGTSEQAEMMARITVPPRTLAEVMPSVSWPPELLRVFERTLSKSPANRPPTAGQFASAFMAAVSPSRRAAANAKTTPLSVPLISASPSATATSGGTASPTADATPAVASAGGASPATSSRRMPMLLGIGAVTVAIAVAGVIWQQGSGNVPPEMNDDSLAPTVVQQPVTTPPDTMAVATNTDDSIEAAAPTGGNTQPPSGAAGPGGGNRPVSVPTSQSGTANTGNTGSTGNTSPPNAPATSTVEPNAVASANVELRKAMDRFDNDDSKSAARETIITIDVLYGRLTTVSDRAWAQNYLGKAHMALDDKVKACAAFASAKRIGASIELVRKDSEEFQLAIGCPP